MAEKKFQPGDVVRVKSGGPPMTIVYYDEQEQVYCQWFDGKKRQDGTFEEVVLEKALPSGPAIAGPAIGRGVHRS
jgi:uncharacterized protein YodC (DUF2158 family)